MTMFTFLATLNLSRQFVGPFWKKCEPQNTFALVTPKLDFIFRLFFQA